MPNIRKKSCERFLSVDELRALLSQASPREHVILRILAVCGLRPARSSFYGSKISRGRNCESTKRSKSASGARGDGTTKTAESDNSCRSRQDLARENRNLDCWTCGSHESPCVPVSKRSRDSVQCRKLFETASETVSGKRLDPRPYPPGIPAHFIHAHAMPRYGQGHAASPPTYRSADHSEALCKGDPREPPPSCSLRLMHKSPECRKNPVRGETSDQAGHRLARECGDLPSVPLTRPLSCRK